MCLFVLDWLICEDGVQRGAFQDRSLQEPEVCLLNIHMELFVKSYAVN